MSQEKAREARIINRLNVRETRSSRAVVSIVVAAVLLVMALWLAMELVLSVTQNAPLLMSPAELAQRLASLATQANPAALVAAGVAAALLGIFLLAMAVLPGTKARHVIANKRSAVVVDNAVLAAALSRTARTAAHLAPEQVATSVSRTRIDVSVHPSSGRAVDTEHIRETVAREVQLYGLRKPLTVGVTSHAAVGS